MVSVSMLIEIISVVPILLEIRKVMAPMISVAKPVPMIIFCEGFALRPFSVFCVSILDETWPD